MNYNFNLNTILSLIFLVWALISIGMFYNHINIQIVYQVFLLAIGILILVRGWCIFGKNDNQSFEYLLKNNSLEFIIRMLIILLTIVIGTIKSDYFVIFFYIFFLYEKICIFGDSKNSLTNLWKSNNKEKVILSIILYVLFFSFIF